jgi:hypothetical protein
LFAPGEHALIEPAVIKQQVNNIPDAGHFRCFSTNSLTIKDTDVKIVAYHLP